MSLEELKIWYNDTIDDLIFEMRRDYHLYRVPMIIFTKDGKKGIQTGITKIEEITQEPKIISLVQFIKKNEDIFVKVRDERSGIVALIYWCHLYLKQEDNYVKSILVTHLFTRVESQVAEQRYFTVDWYNDPRDLTIEEMAISDFKINDPDGDVLLDNPFNDPNDNNIICALIPDKELPFLDMSGFKDLFDSSPNTNVKIELSFENSLTLRIRRLNYKVMCELISKIKSREEADKGLEELGEICENMTKDGETGGTGKVLGVKIDVNNPSYGETPKKAYTDYFILKIL